MAKIFFLDHRSCYLNSVVDSLAQMGHKIFYQSSWLPAEVEAGIAYFKPHILFTVGCDIPLHAPFLDRLPELCRRHGLFHIYWATEDKIFHTTWSIPFVQRIKPDLVWTLDPDCIDNYARHGFKALYMNFAFNPRLFPEKRKDEKENYQISLVGTTHLYAQTYRFQSLRCLLGPVLQAGYQIQIWGYGWIKDEEILKELLGRAVPRTSIHGPLPYKHSAAIYRTSKIMLGIQNSKDQVTQRTFEILGSGSFMIADRTKAITSMFVDRKELALSSSPEETLEIVQYYLEQPDLRYEIGQNARKKVMRQYRYAHRLNQIWPEVDKIRSRGIQRTLRLESLKNKENLL